MHKSFFNSEAMKSIRASLICILIGRLSRTGVNQRRRFDKSHLDNFTQFHEPGQRAGAVKGVGQYADEDGAASDVRFEYLFLL